MTPQPDRHDTYPSHPQNCTVYNCHLFYALSIEIHCLDLATYHDFLCTSMQWWSVAQALQHRANKASIPQVRYSWSHAVVDTTSRQRGIREAGQGGAHIAHAQLRARNMIGACNYVDSRMCFDMEPFLPLGPFCHRFSLCLSLYWVRSLFVGFGQQSKTPVDLCAGAYRSSILLIRSKLPSWAAYSF